MAPRFAFTDQSSQRSWWRVFKDIGPWGAYVLIARGLALHFAIALLCGIFLVFLGRWHESGFFFPFVMLAGWLLGTPIALVIGWPVAATLEWIRWRSWSVYLASGSLVAAPLPLVMRSWTGAEASTWGQDDLVVALAAVGYGLAYAAIYRFRMFADGAEARLNTPYSDRGGG